MFQENIINLPFWTITKMPMHKEYLNHTLGSDLIDPWSSFSLLLYLSELL